MRSAGLFRELAAACLGTLALGAAFAGHACEPREPTRQTGLGPHDFSSAPAERRLWRTGDAGEALSLRLRVLDTCGEPVPGALVRMLHADQDGHHRPDRWRAHLRTGPRGELQVTTVYPGYAGGMARHIHFLISHPGHRALETRLFFKHDPAIVGEGLDDLALVVEEVRAEEGRRWLGGFEFVLAPLR